MPRDDRHRHVNMWELVVAALTAAGMRVADVLLTEQAAARPSSIIDACCCYPKAFQGRCVSSTLGES